MTETMTEIMEGKATPAQIGAFITALRMKGETIAEVTGAARVMRLKATRIDARSPVIVDTCGTGGDGRNTFNISTTAAFVVAATGLTGGQARKPCRSPAARERRRARGHRGFNIDAPPEIVEECVQQVGTAFSSHRSSTGP